jgi:serine/threonine protein kinase
MPSSHQGLPRAGDVLADRFRIERVLGVGGMGGVFAAEDLRFARQVAVKLMLPQLMDIPEFAGRFDREAQAASSLASEHVARVFEIGRLPDGAPYMVLELLQGKDLDRVSRERGPLPVEEAVQYVLETCHAIAEAHGRGIIHRDLKPSNLYLSEREGAPPIVKVLDFGISKSTLLDAGRQGPEGALTSTESTLGSPHYMSPEQLRSAKKVDRRTDVWSLGIILHKLLSGNLAFESESVGAHLAAIVADPPTPLRQHRPDAPAALEAVILRCLQKDLTLRFQNVGQLAVALAPLARPSSRSLIEAVVATVGRDAALAPLAPLPLPASPASPASSPVLAPPAPPALPEPRPDPRQDAATVVRWGATPRPRWEPMPAPLAAPPVAPPVSQATGQTGGSTLPGSALPAYTPAEPRAAGSGRGAWLVVAGGLGVGVVILGAALALSSQRVVVPTVTAADSASAVARAPVAPVTPAAPGTASGAPTVVEPAGEVKIRIEMEPAAATVELDGVVVHDNPIRLPRGSAVHKLVIRAPGYAAATREVSDKEDTALAIVLHRPDAGHDGADPRTPGPLGTPGTPGTSGAQGRHLKGPVETNL